MENDFLRLLQVQGLHAEYDRLRQESEGGGKASKSSSGNEVAKLQAALDAAQKEKRQFEVWKAICQMPDAHPPPDTR